MPQDKNRIRADQLFERAGNLKGLFHTRAFWLCYVYGTMKSSMTERHLDLMEKDLEKCENASKQE